MHVQTLTELKPSVYSYKELFETACKIGVPIHELQFFFRSTVMNVLGGNVDDHNKNFSFLMEQDRKWHFAPTYDYTFVVAPSAQHYTSAMA